MFYYCGCYGTMPAWRDTFFWKNRQTSYKVIFLPCKMLLTGAAGRPLRCTPLSWSSPAGQTTGDKWEEGRTQREPCQTAAPTPLFTEARVSSREVTQYRIREKIWVSRRQKKDTFVTAHLNLSVNHPHVAWRVEICGYNMWKWQWLVVVQNVHISSLNVTSSYIMMKCPAQSSLWCWKKPHIWPNPLDYLDICFQ